MKLTKRKKNSLKLRKSLQSVKMSTREYVKLKISNS